MFVEIYEPAYGQYLAELQDKASGLHAFRPDAVLFAFDARRLTRSFAAEMDETSASEALQDVLAHVTECWGLARRYFGATILQQSVLPVFPQLMGQNEHLLPGSPAAAARLLNGGLRERAVPANVQLVAVDDFAARDGIAEWHKESLWHQAKQEISPRAAPLYGDLVMRSLGARHGRSGKCLVLDLDNTIWGGVVGDDGVSGLTLGQGSAEGEAFVGFQRFARDLTKRGVILAVCSKNDESNALAPFEQHPDMILRRSDVACFRANWDDKATNLRRIAAQLAIGVDSLVFVDDNPFERDLVRRELPVVSVPEMPEDPARYAQAIADGGYFESLAITAEDKARAAQYHAAAERRAGVESVTDMKSYLAGLQMRLLWSPFDEIGLPRIVQLINKSNQFNLTTRRHGDDEVRAVMRAEDAAGLQLRLVDRFGDNGMIAALILRKSGDDAVIDTWLMSCRVLGRRVEEASLAILVDAAAALGCARLLGQYRPTGKNGMVAEHYPKLGFAEIAAPEGKDGRWYSLVLDAHRPAELPMSIEPAF
jgi:FkbH-like protein